MNVLSFAPTAGTKEDTYWNWDGWQVSYKIWIPSLCILVSTFICWVMLSWSGLLKFLGNAKRKDTEKAAIANTNVTK